MSGRVRISVALVCLLLSSCFGEGNTQHSIHDELAKIVLWSNCSCGYDTQHSIHYKLEKIISCGMQNTIIQNTSDSALDRRYSEIREGEPMQDCSELPHVTEYLGMSFIISDPDSHGANIVFLNEKELPVAHGDTFRVYRRFGNGWANVGFIDHTNMSRLMLYDDVPFSSEPYLDFDYYFGGLEPGEYRFYYLLYLRRDISPGTSAEGRPSDIDYYPAAWVFTEFIVTLT